MALLHPYEKQGDLHQKGENRTGSALAFAQ